MRRIVCPTGERGAVAVLVAILMTFLLGAAAIGVDVAQMAATKQELQNGADAGAIAAALDCHTGAASCNQSAAEAIAATYARLNNDVDAVAGVSIDPTHNQLTVVSSGNSDHWLAPILGLDDESLLHASATVGFVAPYGGKSFPLTISYCELTNQLGVVPNPDGSITIPEGTTPPVMTFYTTGTAEATNNGCPQTGSSGDVPGGFGNLAATPSSASAGACFTVSEIDGALSVVPSSPGNTPDSDCGNAYFTSLMLSPDPILVPVFESVTGTGSNAQYTVYGYAAFDLIGYYLNPGQFKAFQSPLTGYPCGGPDRCIAGRFVNFVFPSDVGSVGGTAPLLGATVIRLVD